MPRYKLQLQLDRLSEQLENSQALSSDEREQLEQLIAQVQLQLKLDAAAPETNLLDSLEQAVESFELEHPSLTVTLRNIVQSLASMGI